MHRWVMVLFLALVFTTHGVLAEKSPAVCDNENIAGCLDLGHEAIRDQKFGLAQSYFWTACRAKDLRGCFAVGSIQTKIQDWDKAREIFDFTCEMGLKEGCEALAKLPPLPEPSEFDKWHLRITTGFTMNQKPAVTIHLIADQINYFDVTLQLDHLKTGKTKANSKQYPRPIDLLAQWNAKNYLMHSQEDCFVELEIEQIDPEKQKMKFKVSGRVFTSDKKPEPILFEYEGILPEEEFIKLGFGQNSQE